MGNDETMEKKSNSELYNLVAQSVLELTEEQLDMFLKISKDSNYLELFNYMKSGLSYNECVGKIGNTKVQLRDSLNTLIENLLCRLISNNRKELFDDLMQAEVAFSIGLEEKGISILTRLKSKLKDSDFWIHWRIYELEFMYSSLTARKNIKAPASLYNFTKKYFTSWSQHNQDSENFRGHSDFLNFILSYSKSCEDHNLKIQVMLTEIDELMEEIKQKYQSSSIEGANLINEHFLFLLNNLFQKLIRVIELLLDKGNLEIESVYYKQVIDKIEYIKSFIGFYFPFSHNSWQNYLGLFFSQVQTELNLSVNLLKKVKSTKGLSDDEYWGYRDVYPISIRIEILALCSKILMVEETNSIFILQIKNISKDISSLFKKNSTIKLDDNTKQYLNCIKVLLHEIIGSEKKKVAGDIGDLKRQLLTQPFFKDFVSKDKVEISFNRKMNYLDHTLIFVYNLCWERKSAKRDFIKDIN
jgi:hypothetical protein